MTTDRKFHRTLQQEHISGHIAQQVNEYMKKEIPSKLKTDVN